MRDTSLDEILRDLPQKRAGLSRWIVLARVCLVMGVLVGAWGLVRLFSPTASPSMAWLNLFGGCFAVGINARVVRVYSAARRDVDATLAWAQETDRALQAARNGVDALPTPAPAD